MSRLNLLETLRGSLPFLSRRQSGLPRGEMLALKPRRTGNVTWELTDGEDGPGATLTVPRQEIGLRRLLARWLRVTPSKTVALDEFGAQVWARCDGGHSVEQLVGFTCETYKLNRRQGEVSVVAFMKMLAQRGLIQFPKDTQKKDSHVHHTGSVRPRPQTKKRRRH